jgi:hypothetical protein
LSAKAKKRKFGEVDEDSDGKVDDDWLEGFSNAVARVLYENVHRTRWFKWHHFKWRRVR